MLVVDWKNMTPVKITNISELQVHDLLQFKVSIYFDFTYIYICIKLINRNCFIYLNIDSIYE